MEVAALRDSRYRNDSFSEDVLWLEFNNLEIDSFNLAQGLPMIADVSTSIDDDIALEIQELLS